MFRTENALRGLVYSLAGLGVPLPSGGTPEAVLFRRSYLEALRCIPEIDPAEYEHLFSEFELAACPRTPVEPPPAAAMRKTA